MKTHKAILLSALMISAFGLSACSNTWHGAGQDVERVGEDMQKSVE